jgi:hypothetical protein
MYVVAGFTAGKGECDILAEFYEELLLLQDQVSAVSGYSVSRLKLTNHQTK